MNRFVGALLLLAAVSSSAGTKEDIDKLRSDFLAMQRQVEGLGAALADVNKKMETLESRLDTVQRSSQTADIRMDLDALRREVERIGIELKEFGSRAGTVGLDSGQAPGNPANPGVEPPQQLYQNSYNDYVQSRFEQALGGFKKFTEVYPDDPLAENCHYWIGECYYGLKDYVLAKSALELTLQKYPKGAKSLSARLKLALCMYNLGDRDSAKTALTAIVRESPMSQEAGVAREKLRVLFQD